MKTFLFLSACALMSLTAAATTARIYVTNSAGTEVHVIDPATNKVVQVIEGIEVPHGVNFSPDGSRVYISNEAENALNVVDQKTGKTIKKVPLSGHPNNIAVGKDGGRVFICIADHPASLDVVNTKTLTKTNSIPAKAALHNPYVTPDGKYVVAGSVAGKFIMVVDTQTEKVAWQLDLDKGVRPMAIEAAPDGSTSRIFAELSDLNGFAVVDFKQRKEVGRVEIPKELSKFPLPSQASPSHGIGIAPDGKTLWVNSGRANSVFVYSLPDLKMMGHVSLPTLDIPGKPPITTLPNWITFTPDSATAYISNSGDRSVSAIDMKSLKQIARIRVGEVPKRINTLVVR